METAINGMHDFIGESVFIGDTVIYIDWNDDLQIGKIDKIIDTKPRKCHIKGENDILSYQSSDICLFHHEEQPNITQPITNKELRELLAQYPDDAMVAIEMCNPKHLHYQKENNLIEID